MNCREYNFPAVNFSRAEFRQTADFSKAIFLKDFSDSKFLKK